MKKRFKNKITYMSRTVVKTVFEYVTYKLVNSCFKCNKTISTIILLLIFCLFAIFTFNPPNIGLFKDPITGTFGINYNSLE